MIMVVMASVAASGRTRTTRSINKQSQQEVMVAIPEICDTVAIDTIGSFNRKALSFRGFSKRAGDKKESFYVTNHTNRTIGHFTVMLRYSDMAGKVILERTCNVACRLAPGATAPASIKSFDTQSQFYYYASAKRKTAMPFTVAMRLVSYEVTVSAE